MVASNLLTIQGQVWNIPSGGPKKIYVSLSNANANIGGIQDISIAGNTSGTVNIPTGAVSCLIVPVSPFATTLTLATLAISPSLPFLHSFPSGSSNFPLNPTGSGTFQYEITFI